MWRILYAFVSALTLVTIFTASAWAESHPATSGGGATAPVVTTPPNTGAGLAVTEMPTIQLLAIAGLAGVFALLAWTEARRAQRA